MEWQEDFSGKKIRTSARQNHEGQSHGKRMTRCASQIFLADRRCTSRKPLKRLTVAWVPASTQLKQGVNEKGRRLGAP